MEQKPTLWSVGLKNGVILALILAIYSLLLNFMGLSQNQWLGGITFLILIGGIVWTHKTYKETGDGYMTYAQGLGLGTIVASVSGFVSLLISYIYIKFIDSSSLGLMMDQARLDMEKRGMDDEQIEQALELSQNFMTPEMIFLMGLLSFLFMGFIFSLVISAITKKTNPELQY